MGEYDFGEKSVKMQLAPGSLRKSPYVHIWVGGPHAKNQSSIFENDRTLFGTLRQSSHYLGYIVKVGFWPSASKRSKGRCLNSNEINPRHSQTPNGTIRDQLPFDQNHQGALQSRLKPAYQKSPHMSLARKRAPSGQWRSVSNHPKMGSNIVPT